MSTATVTPLGHSGVRLDKAGLALVIDPGAFSDRSGLETAGAVLVSHEHPDHLDLDRLREAMDDSQTLAVWGPPDVAARLVQAGAPEGRVHAVAAGDRFTAAGFSVEALGEGHAVVYPGLPGVQNRAYLIDGAVLHPGDSLDNLPASAVEVLLLPVSAPWLKLAEAIDYLRAVRPARAVPIHDAILSDAGKQLVDRVVGSLAGDIGYQRLAAGEPFAYGS